MQLANINGILKAVKQEETKNIFVAHRVSLSPTILILLQVINIAFVHILVLLSGDKCRVELSVFNL